MSFSNELLQFYASLQYVYTNSIKVDLIFIVRIYNSLFVCLQLGNIHTSNLFVVLTILNQLKYVYIYECILIKRYLQAKIFRILFSFMIVLSDCLRSD